MIQFIVIRRYALKKNITIICLSNKYKKIVAKELADSLEMFYADINDIMEYNLINSEMLLTAGQQYFDQNEEKTIKTVSDYDNTILTLNLSTLNKNNNLDIIKNNSLIIYVRLNFETYSVLIYPVLPSALHFSQEPLSPMISTASPVFKYSIRGLFVFGPVLKFTLSAVI